MESSEGVFPSIQGNNLNKQSKTVPDDFVDRDISFLKPLTPGNWLHQNTRGKY